ncbi:MAG: hypothetical protein HQK65_22520 [Desulfamplus sp.]|nr:hypothetical protein [Desulfamplus sp.]
MENETNNSNTPSEASLPPTPEEGAWQQSNTHLCNYALAKIPENLSPDEKIEFITNQLTNVSGKHIEALTNVTIYCYILGTLWRELQDITTPEQFNKICKQRFPLTSKKMRTRYMRIAKKTNLEKNQSLATLGQARLLKLATKTEEFQSIEQYLTNNKIDIDIEINNKDAVSRFKNEIDKLLESEGSPEKYTMNTISTQFETAQERLQENIDFITNNPESIEQYPNLISSALEMIEQLNQILDLGKASHK